MKARLSDADNTLIDDLFNSVLANSINLALGQPDFGTPEGAKRAATEAIQQDYTKYTPSDGIPELRELIAEKYRNETGQSYNKGNVLVTTGATEACMSAVLAFSNTGDEVILPDPGFPLYRSQVLVAGATPVFVRLRREDNFRMTPEDVESALTSKTKVIILNSPNNPTGSVSTKDDVMGIAKLLKGKDIIVISDEVYRRFIYDGSHHSIGNYLDTAVVVDAVSKEHDMTGWRVGWALGRSDLIGEMSKIHQAMVTCPSSVSQYAALGALRGGNDRMPSILSGYRERRDYLVDGLRDIGVECEPPSGAFYIFPDISRYGSSVDVSRRIAANGVLVAPGIIFGPSNDGNIRLTYSTSSKGVLSEALYRMKGALRG
ncbi:MAG: pyridoxal phosphate-dependent aminotransferase [Candidatus Aenigmarchaeota archaeon]|nr:pyridoxal phosphate-dependent aminotransferase [Candidatus Aenigmarchaeota archaeon]